MLIDLDGTPLRKHSVLRELPQLDSEWKPPQYYPDLSNADVISFDVENRENDFDHGPGWARGESQMVGFSIAAKKGNERGKWYFPIRHTVEPMWNLDPATTLRWAKETLETPHIPKVGANLIFDVGTLTDENIYVQGKLYDVQFAEALLDEDAFVSLDHLAHKYVRRGKNSNGLYEWLAQAYGGKPNHLQRANIWRAPPRLVGPYGEDDADLPLEILWQQWPLLERQGLLPVFEMECGLIRLIVGMRMQGVTVDLDNAQQLLVELREEIAKLYDMGDALFGIRIESVNAPKQLAKLFDHVGVKYNKTAEGNPSFQKEWLAGLKHPVGKYINQIREYEKIAGTFVQGYLLNRARPVAGTRNLAKLHCSFHPMKDDKNGAKTGRFASSDPNLQNIPVRSKMGKRIRSAFVPDHGHAAWEKCDYSQIEYRMLAHFAVDNGDGSADRLRETYRRNPKTDYHDRVYGMVCPLMGWDFNDPDKELRAARRKPIKNVNFGLVYGQSQPSLAYKAGFTEQQSKEFFGAYHEANPYVRATMKHISKEVQIFGYVKTIMGRRTRFELWEPLQKIDGVRMPALPYEAALHEYGSQIKRAGDYKGTNYKLQGSAAEVIKVAMLKAFHDGVFDVIGYPLLQVHDELDMSVMDLSHIQNEAYAYLHHVLETAMPCNVPIVIDHSRGPTWGTSE